MNQGQLLQCLCPSVLWSSRLRDSSLGEGLLGNGLRYSACIDIMLLLQHRQVFRFPSWEVNSYWSRLCNMVSSPQYQRRSNPAASLLAVLPLYKCGNCWDLSVRSLPFGHCHSLSWGKLAENQRLFSLLVDDKQLHHRKFEIISGRVR